MKMEFLFVSLNLNIIIQIKKAGKCTFYGWCLKGTLHIQMLRLYCSSPSSISGYVPVRLIVAVQVLVSSVLTIAACAFLHGSAFYVLFYKFL